MSHPTNDDRHSNHCQTYPWCDLASGHIGDHERIADVAPVSATWNLSVWERHPGGLLVVPSLDLRLVASSADEAPTIRVTFHDPAADQSLVKHLQLLSASSLRRQLSARLERAVSPDAGMEVSLGQADEKPFTVCLTLDECDRLRGHLTELLGLAGGRCPDFAWCAETWGDVEHDDWHASHTVELTDSSGDGLSGWWAWLVQSTREHDGEPYVTIEGAGEAPIEAPVSVVRSFLAATADPAARERLLELVDEATVEDGAS